MSKFLEIIFIGVLSWGAYQLYTINRELGELKASSQEVLLLNTKIMFLSSIVCNKYPKDCQKAPELYNMSNKKNILQNDKNE